MRATEQGSIAKALIESIRVGNATFLQTADAILRNGSADTLYNTHPGDKMANGEAASAWLMLGYAAAMCGRHVSAWHCIRFGWRNILRSSLSVRSYAQYVLGSACVLSLSVARWLFPGKAGRSSE